jgi:hypothetical protein
MYPVGKEGYPPKSQKKRLSIGDKLFCSFLIDLLVGDKLFCSFLIDLLVGDKLFCSFLIDLLVGDKPLRPLINYQNV